MYLHLYQGNPTAGEGPLVARMTGVLDAQPDLKSVKIPRLWV